jgi:hypothetical protein
MVAFFGDGDEPLGAITVRYITDGRIIVNYGSKILHDNQLIC